MMMYIIQKEIKRTIKYYVVFHAFNLVYFFQLRPKYLAINCAVSAYFFNFLFLSVKLCVSSDNDRASF